MQIVQFLRHHGLYNAGEIAGFDPDIAQNLLNAGIAEAVKAKSPEAPAAPANKNKPAPRE